MKHSKTERLDHGSSTFCGDCQRVVVALMYEAHDYHPMPDSEVCWCDSGEPDMENGR